MIRIFIGYDALEKEGYDVLCHSIHARASRPVSIAPLMLSQLGGLMWRAKDPKQSTEFSFSRFIVPALCDFEGPALFLDSDMLVVDDVARLWDLYDPACSVQVVKHDHVPKAETKSLGRPQSAYPRKNWSSVMLFNCGRCKALTPDYVNSATGLELHRFLWTTDDLIGELPHRWNHLVDYDPPAPIADLSNLHFTTGGPWQPDSRDCGYAGEWRAERARAYPSA